MQALNAKMRRKMAGAEGMIHRNLFLGLIEAQEVKNELAQPMIYSVGMGEDGA